VIARPHGFTTTDLLVTLTTVGLLAALAVPRLERWVRHERLRAAANRLVTDMQLARMQAVRLGRPVAVRFLPEAGTACAAVEPFRAYRGYVVERRGPDGAWIPVAAATDLLFPGACLRKNGPSAIVFDGRGLPAGVYATTVRFEADGFAIEVVVSALGRVRRGP